MAIMFETGAPKDRGLGTDWQELAEKNQETADKALALVDAMNAQERELRDLLRQMTNAAIAWNGDAWRCGHCLAQSINARNVIHDEECDVPKAERLLAERGQ